MDICTLPRMRILITLLSAALAVTLLASPAKARDHHPRPGPDATAKAELQITAVIVPVVLPPRHHERDEDDRDERKNDASVIYNLAPAAEPYSITQRMLPIVNAGAEKGEQVRLITVVLK
jgi:hypothetical protein